MEKQKTIKESIQFSGKGIHTGAFTNMTLLPAKENKGIVFVRTDKDNFEIKADIDFVVSTERSTNLAIKDTHVKTVEHILAAIAGYNIDNLIIEIDNEEKYGLEDFEKALEETNDQIKDLEDKLESNNQTWRNWEAWMTKEKYELEQRLEEAKESQASESISRLN